MNQFMYVADPGRMLQLHNSAYTEQVRTAERRSAQWVTDAQPGETQLGETQLREPRLAGTRSTSSEPWELPASPAGQGDHYEPTRRTRAAERGPRLGWREAVQWRDHAGSRPGDHPGNDTGDTSDTDDTGPVR